MMDQKKTDIKGFMLMVGLLLAFWLVLSASYDWQHIITGTLISVMLAAFWLRISPSEETQHTRFNLKQVLLALYYLLFLEVDIIKANINVAMIVLHPKLPISPGLVIMKNELKRDLPRAIFANSITLTPGTITVELEGDLLIVHAFTRQTALDVQKWPLYELMKKLEEEG